MSIEDIILEHDRRGISSLKPHLPNDFCGQAAKLIKDSQGPTIIVTGFYILSAQAPETDGPPGAIILGKALQEIGHDVTYITDQYTNDLIAHIVGSDTKVIDFPIADEKTSISIANNLLDNLNPSTIVSIERCGFTKEGLYRNMHGQDISEYNAKIDYLFSNHLIDDVPTKTIGIGDGGNEIGMGNLASVIPSIPSLVKLPCITSTTKTIISSVSNWGAYGLVSALSMIHGKNLLPSIEDEKSLIKEMVDLGAVDGFSGKQDYRVDGFSLDENSETLIKLHEYIENHLT